MSRVEAVNRRYQAAEAALENGINLFIVDDPVGEGLNGALKNLLRTVNTDELQSWNEVLGPAKLLRWRTVFRPQPFEFNPTISDLVEAVTEGARRIMPALGVQSRTALRELVEAAQGLLGHNPVVGTVLLESLEEVGPVASVVIADSEASRREIEAWLLPYGFNVITPGTAQDLDERVEVAYVMGPPKFVKTSLVTAPPAGEMTFMMPSWLRGITLPKSAMAAYSEGAISPRMNRYYDAGVGSVVAEEPAPEFAEDDLAPTPIWPEKTSASQSPAADEVFARKLLLSGGYSLWLDEGERIRILDPALPQGERVSYREVSSVTEDVYLICRLGRTDRELLYEQATSALGDRCSDVLRTQEEWKKTLARKLQVSGRTAVESQLRRLGVGAAEQVGAWTDRALARPRKDRDFELLLEWLSIPKEPTFSNSSEFRKARSRAAVRIREELELGVAQTDMQALQSNGHIHLEGEGFAGMIATRVLAMAPMLTIVPRRDVRTLNNDKDGRWLE